MKFSVRIITLSLLLVAAACFHKANGQTTPSEYYKVVDKDSLYIFSSDTHILFFSSPGEDGGFTLLSSIPGSYTSATNFTLNNEYFLIEKNDSLFLYDISDIYHPDYLFTQVFGFAISQIYGFENFFVITVGNTLKLIEPQVNSFVIVEDTLITLNKDPLFMYPYIVVHRNIYKYLENFGVFQIYYIDEGMDFYFLAGDQLVYITVQYSPPPLPPSICGIRGRIFQEPNFPYSFRNDFWADCLPAYVLQYFEGSKQYIYLWEYRTPPNDRKIVVNFAGTELYHHLSLEYKLKLTDVYLFQLGHNILYSTPADPDSFNVLEFSVTSMNDDEINSSEYQLKQNYPNPFNPSTSIVYSINRKQFVTLKVYDILGNEVAILVNEEQPAGNHTIDYKSTSLPSGVYFYQLRAGSFVETKKMVVLK